MRKPRRYFASNIFFNLSYEGKEPERITFFCDFGISPDFDTVSLAQDQSIKLRGLVFM